MNQDEPQHEVADVSFRIKEASRPKELGRARRFVKGTLKLTTAFLVAALVLAGIAAGIAGVVYLREEARNRPLAELKTWRQITVPSLEGATFSLGTKWRDGQMYYQFYLVGYPAQVRKELENAGYPGMENKGFSIVFLDQTGFKLGSTWIPLHSMTRLVGGDGGFNGLSMNDRTGATADWYRQIASWEVQWHL